MAQNIWLVSRRRCLVGDRHRLRKPPIRLSKSGFTLVELMVVLLIIGVLAIIIAVGWRSFWNARVLGAAQDEIFQAMRQAQAYAVRSHTSWRASFQEPAGVVQWAIHPAERQPTAADWHSLYSGVHIDRAETTLPSSGGVYRAEFDARGNIPPPFGRITLSMQDGGSLKRCVFSSTLLGVIRKAQNQSSPDQTGRYCY